MANKSFGVNLTSFLWKRDTPKIHYKAPSTERIRPKVQKTTKVLKTNKAQHPTPKVQVTYDVTVSF